MVRGMLKRLQKERNDHFEELRANGVVPDDDYSVVDAADGALLRLVVRVTVGPYAGLPFVLVLQFPRDYPFEPPNAWWATPIQHPNVTIVGHIGCCGLGLIGVCYVSTSSWSPAYTIRLVARDALAMLKTPQFAHPLNDLLTRRLPNKDHLSPEYQRFVRAATLEVYPCADDLVVLPEGSETPLSLLRLAASAACDAHGGAEAAAKAAEESSIPDELIKLLRSARRCHICGVLRAGFWDEGLLEFGFRDGRPVRIRACSQRCKQTVVEAYTMAWEPDGDGQ